MDLTQEQLEALPADVRDTFTKPEVKAALASFVESAKKPLVAKRDELLATLSANAELIKSFGGADAIKALKDQADAANRAASEAASRTNDVESIKKTYSEQLATVTAELTAIKESAKAEKVSSAIGKAIRESNGVTEFLEPHVAKRVRAEVVDGAVKLTVLGSNGAPMLNADGKDASMKDLMSEFKANAVFARAFDAPLVSGSGVKPTHVNGVGEANPWNPASPNFTEQNRIAKENPQLAMKMAAAHGKTLKL